ncbi:DUF397 domain-containing protein [Streptomyces sp. NBC_00335]|uniref:DUF397 domain-containing protein n=1 Tax=unclassified Streptomyces TaxID=2593676 RepID=UPI002258A98C|nr:MULTISPECIES: DUF397 domain-containing protein [unclassified Streptomyces]MCX5405889.1 DUF397 domain-containing protein [Streptomyces sp. NBC_00086]
MKQFNFVKSSYSDITNDSDCVEVATNIAGTVAVRDSKQTDGPVIEMSGAAWTAFATQAG